MMLARLTILSVMFVSTLSAADTHELEGDYLYKVSTVRAASGSLSDLLDWTAALRNSGYYDDSGVYPPFVMRHSQGDQWDLMIITPIESWTVFHSTSTTRKRDDAASDHADLLSQRDALIAFEEDHFAYGPELSAVSAAYEDNSFFHIEMFRAGPGKAAELFEQRRKENAYLKATGLRPNMIFRRAAGSDIDVFTIGFHNSLEAFAAPSDEDDETREAAAKDAGFRDRADISFYLRSLISGHHDTLAVKVKWD